MMRPFTIGIGGGSASGKSWLTRRLLRDLGTDTAVALAHDDYYHPLPATFHDRPHAYNFDEPQALESTLLAEHLAALRDGRPVAVPRYDFTTHSRVGERTIHPRPVILVEGILLFTEPAVRRSLDLRVFVHAPTDVRLERRVARDVAERGRDPHRVRARFRDHVEPMHQQHVAPTRDHAHLVVDGRDPLDDLARHVLRHLPPTVWPAEAG